MASMPSDLQPATVPAQVTGNTSAANNIKFPNIIFPAVIVAAGIYYVSTINTRAAWGLAILIVLVIAFAYQSFNQELLDILGMTNTSTGPNTGVTSQTQTPSGPVGPVGPAGGRT